MTQPQAVAQRPIMNCARCRDCSKPSVPANESGDVSGVLMDIAWDLARWFLWAAWAVLRLRPTYRFSVINLVSRQTGTWRR
jgi:hypothetical protein